MARSSAHLLVVGAALALAACGDDGAADLPDILLVSLDTLRADRVSAYGIHPAGDGRVTTPNLDALAARGVLFADATAPASQTAPSHVSIFTGLDPLAHGVRNASVKETNSTRLADEVPMLSEVLRDAGYYTGVLGDTGNVHPDMGFDRGFDHQVFGMSEVVDKLEQVRDFGDEVPAGAPAFLFFHTYQIHAPYLPPARLVGRWSDPSYSGVFRERYEGLVGRSMSAAFGDAGSFLNEFDGMGDVDIAWLADLYDENVLYTDEGFGQLLEVWERVRGPGSIVVVLSDHGEEFGEHGGLGHRRDLHRVLTHVPLIVAGPGIATGVVEAPVSLTGLPATLCEWLGIDAPSQVQSGSFAAALTDPTGLGAEFAFSQLLIGRKAGFYEGISTDRWHFVRTASEDGVSEALYDLDADPAGVTDVRAVHDAATAELLEHLGQRRMESITLQEQHPTLKGPRLSVKRQRELEALGYTGD